jgi:hypothetical protein
MGKKNLKKNHMKNIEALKKWQELPKKTQENIFIETAKAKGLPPHAIEKDWWVVQTLNAIFSLPFAEHLVFKGGTSLSKGWGLIDRFSEDIDLALDRRYFEYDSETLSKQELKKIRKKLCTFAKTTFVEALKTQFYEASFTDVEVKPRAFNNSDQDPMIIEIFYPKLTEADAYLKAGVLIEISVRSLLEPSEIKSLSSFVAEKYSPGMFKFSDKPIEVKIATPEKTFLEKIFLLHEEFQKTPENMRVSRLSRHLYDIEKLTAAGYADTALANQKLYQIVVKHRSIFTAISGVNYLVHHTFLEK